MQLEHRTNSIYFFLVHICGNDQVTGCDVPNRQHREMAGQNLALILDHKYILTSVRSQKSPYALRIVPRPQFNASVFSARNKGRITDSGEAVDPFRVFLIPGEEGLLIFELPQDNFSVSGAAQKLSFVHAAQAHNRLSVRTVLEYHVEPFIDIVLIYGAVSSS